jgi:Dipeptidase
MFPINRLAKFVNRDLEKFSSKIDSDIELLKMANGKILSNQNFAFKLHEIKSDIKKAEFKVFSQWGDDGIIDFLIKYLDINSKRFIEFGVENYTECNTRFLLMNENWSGLIFDGSKENMESVKNENISWKYDLTAISAFITSENINDLIKSNGFSGDIGLLHIDIDGNDYWVWKSIEVINPIIVIIEYNSIFGFENPWTVPYDQHFVRGNKHFSNLYYGTSLLSIYDLGLSLGYNFIGCNSNGNNAYFVRKDKIKDLEIQTAKSGYVYSKFSESRDENGNLTYLKNEKRLQLIKGLPIYNTRTNSIETIK